MNRLYLAVFTSAFVFGTANAQGLRPIRPLPGYVCLQLALSPEEIADPARGVPARDVPSLSGRIVGWAASVVFAPADQQPNAGFLQIVFPDGHRGWVRDIALKPWRSPSNPNRKCIPSVMSDGLIGFDFK